MNTQLYRVWYKYRNEVADNVIVGTDGRFWEIVAPGQPNKDVFSLVLMKDQSQYEVEKGSDQFVDSKGLQVFEGDKIQTVTGKIGIVNWDDFRGFMFGHIDENGEIDEDINLSELEGFTIIGHE